MKPSNFARQLKACKDGVTMTIHRLPNHNTKQTPNAAPTRTKGVKTPTNSRHRKQSHESLSRFQTPGTPGSTMSESSAGYHSAHSLPSVYSSAVSPEIKIDHSMEMYSPHSQQSGYEMGLDLQVPRHRIGSDSSGLTRSHPGTLYSGRLALTSPRRSYEGNSQLSVLSPRSETSSRHTYSRSRSRSSNASHRHFSASYDHLDTVHYPTHPRMGRTYSHDRPRDHHMTTTVATPTYPRPALSLSSMRPNKHAQMLWVYVSVQILLYFHIFIVSAFTRFCCQGDYALYTYTTLHS